MRIACLSVCLTLLAALAPAAGMAFEIESRTEFPVDAPRGRLDIISTADREVFAPFIRSFQKDNPDVAITYITATTQELMRAVYEERHPFDLAISSAMDLQTKLANDGLTQPHVSAATRRLPDWARWRDNVFAFTREPATIVISPAAFEGLDVPRTRQALLALLRDNGERFRGRIGTYDVRESGLGFLFATQDARTSETYWRLSEVMGSLGTRLYCCSADMIGDVATGRLAVAYNVLGSYAEARRKLGDDIEIIRPEDFTTMMLRTLVIPANAPNPAMAGEFADHLIRLALSPGTAEEYPFPTLTDGAGGAQGALRPIALGPGLLVYLDRLKRRRFLEAWENAMVQD